METFAFLVFNAYLFIEYVYRNEYEEFILCAKGKESSCRPIFNESIVILMFSITFLLNRS